MTIVRLVLDVAKVAGAAAVEFVDDDETPVNECRASAEVVDSDAELGREPDIDDDAVERPAE